MLGAVYGTHQREGKRPLKVPPLARHLRAPVDRCSWALPWLGQRRSERPFRRRNGTVRNARSLDDLLGRGINQLLDAGCDEISFVALAFKETERVFDGIVGPREVQPASFPGAQRGRRDANGSREACDPLVAVKGAPSLLQEVGGCVSCRFHNTTGSLLGRRR